jgi:hypothetical protein
MLSGWQGTLVSTALDAPDIEPLRALMTAIEGEFDRHGAGSSVHFRTPSVTAGRVGRRRLVAARWCRHRW